MCACVRVCTCTTWLSLSGRVEGPDCSSVVVSWLVSEVSIWSPKESARVFPTASLFCLTIIATRNRSHYLLILKARTRVLLLPLIHSQAHTHRYTHTEYTQSATLASLHLASSSPSPFLRLSLCALCRPEFLFPSGECVLIVGRRDTVLLKAAPDSLT